MDWLIDQLRSGGRIGEAARQIESGEPVDWQKIDRLGPLDLVRAGQQFLADALQEEREADERAAQFLRGLG